MIWRKVTEDDFIPELWLEHIAERGYAERRDDGWWILVSEVSDS